MGHLSSPIPPFIGINNPALESMRISCMTRANQTVRNASLHIEKLPTVGIGFRIGIRHEGLFLARRVRSGDKSARSKADTLLSIPGRFCWKWGLMDSARERCVANEKGQHYVRDRKHDRSRKDWCNHERTSQRNRCFMPSGAPMLEGCCHRNIRTRGWPEQCKHAKADRLLCI